MMARHISKVHPQVRSLVAWQDARNILAPLKLALRRSARTDLNEQITSLAAKAPDLIEQGHLQGLNGERAGEISLFWKAAEALDSLQALIEQARAKAIITAEGGQELAACIERARASLAALIRVSET